MSEVLQQDNLAWLMLRLSQMEGAAQDELKIRASIPEIKDKSKLLSVLYGLCEKLDLPVPICYQELDQAALPLVTYFEEKGWGIVIDRAVSGGWIVEYETESKEELEQKLKCSHLIKVQWTSVEDDFEERQQFFKDRLNRSLRMYNPVVFEACIATLFIGLLALGTSLFSMQVYDRVIPGRSEDTLIVLAVGVGIAIAIELAMKLARTKIMDEVVMGLDARLSRDIFEKLLSIRLDQLPSSVGSLASQIRGYEQIRSFYTASTLFALVDVPLGCLFLFAMVKIGDLTIAGIVFVAVLISLTLGFLARSKINKLAKDGAQYANQKTGILVETVEGAETIKAGGGNWKFIAKWMNINSASIQNDAKSKSVSEHLNYSAAALQQASYACLVVAGALIVMDGKMTMGSLIACSILSGRVLTPVMGIPGLIVQYAHVRAALDGLEKLYQLKVDNDGLKRALHPQVVTGSYQLENVSFKYPGANSAIEVKKLVIRSGERIAILGPIGSGKSTLLRLLAGLYAPTTGQILLNGLDLNHISRLIITKNIGYLQQEHRLFQGTLRENLLIGTPDPGDEIVLDAMKLTGMHKFVSSHPMGLDRPIMEGGKGLSGGQRQLLAFTRLILCKPNVLLLDEPTASMDEEQEIQCLNALKERGKDGKTLIVVTHKPSVLSIVDRVIVVIGNQIVLDGPKNAVLSALNKSNPQPVAQVVNA